MRLSFILPFVVASLALASCSDGDNAKRADAGLSKGRPALVIRETEVPRWIAVSGEVATVDQAQVIARIPGILTRLSVKEGDYVRKGQIIGRIVDSQLAYQSGAFGAQAAAARAQAAQAQAELSRVKFLHQNGVYAKARLEQAQAAASAAQAEVNAALAQQRSVKAVAGQGVVVAPTDGRVLTANIPAGSPVVPGSPIATITSGPVVLRIDMPESLASKVNAGTAIRVTQDDGQVISGSLSRIYPSVNAGKVWADVSMPALDSSLIGRRLSAEVDSGARKALAVPASYVTTRFGVDYVMLAHKNEPPSMVPVQIAPLGDPDKVEILSGVSAGDRLLKPAEGAANK